jgi:hypothetical protein
MRIYKSDQRAGASILAIGQTGVGKTWSLKTVTDNLLLINTEPKNPVDTINKSNMKVIGMEDFQEGLVFLTTLSRHIRQTGKCELTKEFFDDVSRELKLPDGFFGITEPFPIHTVALDSITAYSRIIREIMEGEEEKSVAEDILAKLKRPMRQQEKYPMSWAGWHVLASMMLRIMSALNTLTDYGINVIILARASNDGFGLDITLDGKEFKRHIWSYCNGVGVVVPDEGTSKYPPRIIFCPEKGLSESVKPPGTLLANPAGGPLDWEVIFDLIKQEKERNLKNNG